MDEPSVLLTDGDMRVTLPVLRSLSKKGIETVVAASDTRAISFFSRYCKKRVLCPSSRDDLYHFLNVMRRIIRETKSDILFPVGEWTLMPISEHRQEIVHHTKLPWVEHDTIYKTFDKSLTLKLALEEGVPIPRTFFVKNDRELEEAAKKASYPAVIKPRWSWVWKGGKALFRRPNYVNSEEELISTYKSVHEDFPFPLIQEYVPGKTYDVAVIYNHPRLRAACCIEEHRAHPPTGGYSSFRESVTLDPKMKDHALRLLKALEWYGVAELEFKLDPRDSIPKLMEINGRFWGSLEVAIGAGLDFPYLLYRTAVDGDVKPVSNYKVGVKRRWFEGDLLHLTSVLRNESPIGDQRLDSWKAIKGFLKLYEKNMAYDCFYWDDPLPFISGFFCGDIPNIVYRKIVRKLEKLQTKFFGGEAFTS